MISETIILYRNEPSLVRARFAFYKMQCFHHKKSIQTATGLNAWFYGDLDYQLVSEFFRPATLKTTKAATTAPASGSATPASGGTSYPRTPRVPLVPLIPLIPLVPLIRPACVAIVPAPKRWLDGNDDREKYIRAPASTEQYRVRLILWNVLIVLFCQWLLG